MANNVLKKLLPFCYLSGFLFGSCEGLRSGYRVESDTVIFYSGFPATPYVVRDADASSFKAINQEYGKDKKHVFYRNTLIEKADPLSFKILAGAYTKDKNYGFAVSSKATSAVMIISHEPDFFDVVPNPDETLMNHTAEGIMYAHDDKHVFKGDQILVLADPATFEYIPMRSGSGFNLTRDKNYVYWHDKPIEGVSSSTFQKISNDYVKDKQAIWSTKIDNRGQLCWVRLPYADIATFRVIDQQRGIAQDKNHSYYNGDFYTESNPEK